MHCLLKQTDTLKCDGQMDRQPLLKQRLCVGLLNMQPLFMEKPFYNRFHCFQG